MAHVTFFAIRPALSQPVPALLLYREEKGELFLGPHVRLCGLIGMARIDSEALARQFAAACAPLLQRRYGGEASLDVVFWETSERKKLIARINRDSEIIRRRLATKNFTPNRSPYVSGP